jgi:hypothetical protein
MRWSMRPENLKEDAAPEKMFFNYGLIAHTRS